MKSYKENTVGWWLQKSLPNSLAERAIEESTKQGGKGLYINTSSVRLALNYAFEWDASKEGGGFWLIIYNELKGSNFYVPEKWFVLYSNEGEFKEISLFYNKHWSYVEGGGYYTDPVGNHSNWVTSSRHNNEQTNHCKNLPDQGYIQLTMEEWREHICKKNNQQNMKEEKKMFTVTREQIKILYDGAKSGCHWREKLKGYAEKIPWDKNETRLDKSTVDKMFNDANGNQKEILRGVFPDYKEEEKSFTAADLKVGEMMRVLKGEGFYSDKILLRTYDSIVSLSSPDETWTTDARLKGEKLPSGYEVIITAK